MNRDRHPLSSWPRRLRRSAADLPAESVARGIPTPLPAHAGLWLDRCLQWEPGSGPDSSDGGWPAREALFEAAVQALRPPGAHDKPSPALESYGPVFLRWRDTLAEPASGVTRHTVELVTTGRVLLHPASGSTVTDGAILLHHTYGVPYLPGSALKGAVRRGLAEHYLAARADPGRAEEVSEPPAVGQILGSARQSRGSSDDDEAPGGASRIDFLDALWVPARPPDSATDWSPLALDVVTPHHPKYYTAKDDTQEEPPDPLLDSEDPVPSQRLAIAPGCRFLVVAETAETFPEAWAEWLLQTLLPTVLTEQGLGAWTNAGYGRLRAARSAAAVDKTIEELAAPLWQEVVVRLKANTGELTATLPDGTEAFASREEALALREGLAASAAKKLKTRKKARLEIKTEPLGLRRRIAGLRVPDRES